MALRRMVQKLAAIMDDTDWLIAHRKGVISDKRLEFEWAFHLYGVPISVVHTIVIVISQMNDEHKALLLRDVQ